MQLHYTTEQPKNTSKKRSNNNNLLMMMIVQLTVLTFSSEVSCIRSCNTVMMGWIVSWKRNRENLYSLLDLITF